MTTTYQVKDAGDPRKYFSIIPNMIDDLPLSVYAYRLYGHLKRVSGENGTCWQSTRTLAKACHMSNGSIVKAKAELEKLGLIEIQLAPGEYSQYDHHEITCVDIWQLNHDACSPRERTVSPRERTVSPRERTVSPREPKKNPIKKNPILTSPPELPLPSTTTYPNAPESITHTPPEHAEYKPLVDDTPAGQARGRIIKAVQSGNGNHNELSEMVYKLFRLNANWGAKRWKAFSAFMRDKSLDDLTTFDNWWHSQDWRGKQGQEPAPEIIMEIWPQAFLPSCHIRQDEEYFVEEHR